MIVEAADRRTGELLGLVKIDLGSHNWREYEAKLSVSRTCATPKSGCACRLTTRGGTIMCPPACCGSITYPCCRRTISAG
ncbi:hypothetical protein HMSSN036_80640 [Paenibacillus macerans]|nr:hypothetical protein HMSSN036_80640 [Paenibacillus macerans]